MGQLNGEVQPKGDVPEDAPERKCLLYLALL